MARCRLSGWRRRAWCSTLAAVAELARDELNAMVAEATIDAYGEEEQVSGFYNLIEEPLPAGWEWIAAYRHWAR
jgi:hypothetical protein